MPTDYFSGGDDHNSLMNRSESDWAKSFIGDRNIDPNKWLKDYGEYFQAYDPERANMREEQFGEQRSAMGQQFRSEFDQNEQKAGGGLSFSGIGEHRLESMRDAYTSSVEGALSSRDKDKYGYEKEYLSDIYDTGIRLNEAGAFETSSSTSITNPEPPDEWGWADGTTEYERRKDKFGNNWEWYDGRWMREANDGEDWRSQERDEEWIYAGGDNNV